mgnify:CR=1 FL=1
MFCPKCGTQMADTAAFCPKCGQAVKQESATFGKENSNNILPMKSTPAKETEGKQQSDKLKNGFTTLYSSKPFKQALPIVLAALVLIVGLMAGIKLLVENGGTISVGTFPNGSKGNILDVDKQKELTELTVDEATVLDGEYPKLERIISNGATVTLYGEFPSLKTVVMNPDEDVLVGDFVFEYGVTFPALISFEGGVIVTNDFDEEGFCPEAFPNIQTMHFFAKNSQVDEFWMQTLATGLSMQKAGDVREVTYEIEHEMSDLYGVWRDENNILTLTFQSDGSVRVAESKNIIGVDALTFEEVDEDTLKLKTKNPTGNALVGIVTTLISFNMDYELFGDELFVSFNGKNFQLSRE